MFIDLGGTVRAQSAADTLARLKPLLPKFGITRVMAQEGLGNIKIPVSISCRPNSRFVSTSQGKGITRELADISAIMESIEGFHAERLPQPVLTADVSELERSGRSFIAPTSLAIVPQLRPHSHDDPIAWLALERLSGGEPVLVPRSFLSMDQTTVKMEVATWNLFVTTNGLASGNTTEEAIVHGLYELIERDCVYEHRYERAPEERMLRRVALESIQDIPHISELLRLLDDAEMNLSVTAIHGRLGVPAFAAMVRPRALVDRAVSSGCGAHYVPEVALSRAITEAVQSRITYISGSRDDVMPWQYMDLNAAPEPPSGDPSSCFQFADTPRPPRFAAFPEVLRWTGNLLEAHGFKDTCYFNHQRPEYGDIPVVTVVCPGLRVDLMIAHQAKKD